MGRIALIDLGEIPAEQVFDDTPARASPHRRWISVGLVLAAALSTLAAGDPVQRPQPTAVLDVPGDARVLVDGDRLFVIQPFALSQSRGDGRYVAAYHLMDLEPLWRVELPLGDEVFGMTAVDRVLALTGAPPRRQGDGGARSLADDPVLPDTVGLDPATGALLWRHKGFVEGTTPGGRLILSAERDNPGAIPASSGPGRSLRAVAGTGEVVWSYDPPAGALRSYRLAGEAATLLAVVLPAGGIELRDTETGALVRSGHTGPLGQTGAAGRYVEIVGDLLLVRDGSQIQAYGTDRLDLRWRLPFQPGRDGWFTACGDVICVVHERGGLQALDPSTGRVRWSDSRWTQGFAVGGGLIATDWDPRHDQETVVAVDPYTGRVKRDLGRWHRLDTSGGSVLALRFDSTRVLVARLDPARGARLVGVMPDVVAASCRVRLPYLWCRRTDNTVGVWQPG